MFLRIPTLKKLLKEAYTKGGLTVGGKDDGVFLEGRYWVIWLAKADMPNKTKAAIIEFAGELPEEGIIFKVAKDKATQYELPTNEYWDVNHIWNETKVELIETPVSIIEFEDRIRLFQSEESRTFKGIDSKYLNLIDTKEIDHGIESNLQGPSCMSEESSMLLWKNSHCTLMICEQKLNRNLNKKMLEQLSIIDFERDYEVESNA